MPHSWGDHRPSNWAQASRSLLLSEQKTSTTPSVGPGTYDPVADSTFNPARLHAWSGRPRVSIERALSYTANSGDAADVSRLSEESKLELETFKQVILGIKCEDLPLGASKQRIKKPSSFTRRVTPPPLPARTSYCHSCSPSHRSSSCSSSSFSPLPSPSPGTMVRSPTPRRRQRRAESMSAEEFYEKERRLIESKDNRNEEENTSIKEQMKLLLVQPDGAVAVHTSDGKSVYQANVERKTGKETHLTVLLKGLFSFYTSDDKTSLVESEFIRMIRDAQLFSNTLGTLEVSALFRGHARGARRLRGPLRMDFNAFRRAIKSVREIHSQQQSKLLKSSHSNQMPLERANSLVRLQMLLDHNRHGNAQRTESVVSVVYKIDVLRAAMKASGYLQDLFLESARAEGVLHNGDESTTLREFLAEQPGATVGLRAVLEILVSSAVIPSLINKKELLLLFAIASRSLDGLGRNREDTKKATAPRVATLSGTTDSEQSDSWGSDSTTNTIDKLYPSMKKLELSAAEKEQVKENGRLNLASFAECMVLIAIKSFEFEPSCKKRVEMLIDYMDV